MLSRLEKREGIMTRAERDQLEQHVMKARKAGIALSRYARENGLSVDAIYVANGRLRKQGVITIDMMRRSRGPLKTGQTIPERKLPAFVPVKVAAVTPAVTPSIKVLLPNGIELQLGSPDAAALPMLVQALASLPCSR